MTIRNIDFGTRPLFLAPMEDVTDIAFRLICKEFGADLVYSEFVAADALIRNISRTKQKLTILENERPVAVQIYGKDVETMVEAAKIVEQSKPDILDLNFGCPVKKIASKGAGAGMLRDIPKMLAITKAVVDAVKIPVTVKTRLGWDENSKIINTLALQLQDCGIEALAIHGRTRSQMYTGTADWTMIGEVKNNPAIKIPIIGNGDVTTPEQAKECFDKYNVDAIMIGRGAIGCPWIFAEIKNALVGAGLAPAQNIGLAPTQNIGLAPTQNTGLAYSKNTGRPQGSPLPTDTEKKIILKNYILKCVEYLADERKGIIHARRHIAATPLFKGISHFRETKIAMLRAITIEELFGLIDEVNV